MGEGGMEEHRTSDRCIVGRRPALNLARYHVLGPCTTHADLRMLLHELNLLGEARVRRDVICIHACNECSG